ncbi:MAG: hypothetical protein IPG00_15830 [Saprospiraceae bacterium]|nr:hypothetical protein [Saprospiraceae bacterium]
MKIVLSDINNILFPENYANRKDPLRKQKEYLMQTERDNYLEGLRNIKFVVKITKLSFTIEDKNDQSICDGAL